MNWYRNFDWITVLSWISLSFIGLIAIYSATQGPVSQFLPEYIQDNFYKQLVWVSLSIIIVISLQFTAPRTFSQVAYLFYGFCLLLTIYTLYFGIEINGARSWIDIFGFRLQVSEMMKVGTILAVAHYLSNRRNIQSERLDSAFMAVIIILTPAILVLMQNDTGTALVIFALIPFMLFWSGLPYGISLYIISPAIIGYFTLLDWVWGALAAAFLALIIFIVQKRPWLTVLSVITSIIIIAGINVALTQVLQPYQRDRIQAFANPSFDPQGSGWNVIQAKTAIGSGGLTGKGFLEGTQTQLKFLPEQWTDFIFCVIGEEFGFIGAGLVLLLFMILLTNLMSGAGNHKNPFAQSVLVGIVSIFLIHLLINTGSAMGLLPVIGIPLPFISYGGSAFLANSLMIGIALNLLMYKRESSMYV